MLCWLDKHAKLGVIELLYAAYGLALLFPFRPVFGPGLFKFIGMTSIRFLIGGKTHELQSHSQSV